MVAVSAVILTLRTGYWRLALVGSISYLTLYLPILKYSWTVFPAFSSEWNWAGLCGISVIGFPLEEVAWAAGYGVVWPLIMAYTLEARTETPGRIDETDLSMSPKQAKAELIPQMSEPQTLYREPMR